MVVAVASGLRRIVANMYNPFSVKALGKVLVLEKFVVEKFHRKSSNSNGLSSKTYPSGNLSGLFLTDLLMSRVATPYKTAMSVSKITFCLILPLLF